VHFEAIASSGEAVRKTTINDVAARAGVSRATADRVLNRRGGVSAEKERAVLNSARALGLDRNLDVVQAKMLRVCVLMQSPENPFYERLGHGFREANLAFETQKICTYVNHIDVLAPERIRYQLQRTAREYDALIIVAPASESTIDAVRIIATRIPVVTLATDLPVGAGHQYVGPDNHKAGRLAGELMGRMLGRAGGNVLVVAGLREFSGHVERKSGFIDVLTSDFPRCRIVVEIDNLDQGAKAADDVATALGRHPNISGIYNISQGNDAIVRRIEALGAARRKVVFICHDLTSTTKALLRSRQIDVVIDQDPLLEARRAVELILQHYGRLAGRQVSGATPLHVFFRENVDDDRP
jgi:LacI family transcriptional regulator